MANIILSTGLKNVLAGKASIKEALANSVLEIFSGVAPTDADSAESGTKLVRVTVNGETFSGSSAQISMFNITSLGSNGDTLKVTLTPVVPSGTAEEFTVTQTSSEDTLLKLAIKVCNTINASCSFAIAFPSVDGTYGKVSVKSRVPGDSFSMSTQVTGNITVSSVSNVVENVRGTDLHFELFQNISSGAIEKYASENWKGTVLANGTASWFRIKSPTDDGSSSTTAIRLQGNVGTLPGVALKFTGSVNLVKDTTLEIWNFKISVP